MNKENLHTEDDLRYMFEKYIQNRDERTLKQVSLMIKLDYITHQINYLNEKFK